MEDNFLKFPYLFIRCCSAYCYHSSSLALAQLDFLITLLRGQTPGCVLTKYRTSSNAAL